jgi:predicted RNA-binding protein YlxR (DUF448 family)
MQAGAISNEKKQPANVRKCISCKGDALTRSLVRPAVSGWTISPAKQRSHQDGQALRPSP